MIAQSDVPRSKADTSWEIQLENTVKKYSCQEIQLRKRVIVQFDVPRSKADTRTQVSDLHILL